MAELFMGIDSSTQSLSVIIINADEAEVVYRDSIRYDDVLPDYGTVNGVLQNADPTVVHSPPLMWVEALDVIFERMHGKVDLSSVMCIAGSGQQHGSVYLNDTAERSFAEMSSSRSLADNLCGIFSRETSPIWMDSSTETECEEIMKALGGKAGTAEATGSTAFERFTGPQIRKFYKQESDNYERTRCITLVSAFMASVIAGKLSPIDHGDGAGMNLMDIHSKKWYKKAVKHTAPNLGRLLPPLAPSDTTLGKVSQYYVDKYGLNPDAGAMVWSGDNPNSIIGLGLVKPGMTGISLGTSDTYFGFMVDCHTDPEGEGHVFGAPTGDYMTLIAFKNGSLARERVKDKYGLNWEGFSQALQRSRPGNNGKLMLPYFEPEIVPKVLKPAVKRFNLPESDVNSNCRAVVEAQMMSMRIHSEWMGRRPTKIHATGGASENEEILQIMADVHNCPVYRFEVSNSAALGAALRAHHGYLGFTGEAPDWPEVVSGFADPVEDSKVVPQEDAVRIYDGLVEKYRECEREFSSS